MSHMLRKTLTSWIARNPFTQSAAAAYYAIFALPGLIMIILSVATLFFDRAEVEQEILGHIRTIMGADTAESVSEIVTETRYADRETWAMIIGIGTLMFGATGLFVQLQTSLNLIFEVEVKKSAGVWPFIRDRAISLSMIVIIGFLMLVSLTLTALLTLFGEWLTTQVPPFLVQVMLSAKMVVSFVTIAALFSLLFKILPDAVTGWRAAWRGGALSAALFILGEYAINMYFSFAKPGSTFGEAGSIILLMIWVYYSCMILLIGAEFTKIYHEEKSGQKVKPTGIAKRKLNKET